MKILREDIWFSLSFHIQKWHLEHPASTVECHFLQSGRKPCRRDADIQHLSDICNAETTAGVSLGNLSFFQKKPPFGFDAVRCGRLSSLGLLHQLHPMSFGFTTDNHYLISDRGKYLCRIIENYNCLIQRCN